jgi:hypothetical protein
VAGNQLDLDDELCASGREKGMRIRRKVDRQAVGACKSIGVDIELCRQRQILVGKVGILIPFDMRDFRGGGKETQRRDDFFDQIPVGGKRRISVDYIISKALVDAGNEPQIISLEAGGPRVRSEKKGLKAVEKSYGRKNAITFGTVGSPGAEARDSISSKASAIMESKTPTKGHCLRYLGTIGYKLDLERFGGLRTSRVDQGMHVERRNQKFNRRKEIVFPDRQRGNILFKSSRGNGRSGDWERLIQRRQVKIGGIVVGAEVDKVARGRREPRRHGQQLKPSGSTDKSSKTVYCLVIKLLIMGVVIRFPCPAKCIASV